MPITINPTPGAIGQKIGRNNLLTYAITSDVAMQTITEKVNGQVINTRNAPASGQQYTVTLTDTQWDAVKYGKYANATGGLNELSIEMGGEKWTYTFDKQLANDADLLSTTKASMDAATVSEPAKKALLANIIREKGGSVAVNPSFESLSKSVQNLKVGGRKASGYVIPSGTNRTFEVRGLSFAPSVVTMRFAYTDLNGAYQQQLLFLTTNNHGYTYGDQVLGGTGGMSAASVYGGANLGAFTSNGLAALYPDGFKSGLTNSQYITSNPVIYWWAYE